MEPYEPNKSFDYDKVTLENPRPVQGGSYFTKITMDSNKLLYVQFPKCLTKQGVIVTKRGKYCDLMYERMDEGELVEWIENLESRCHDLIDAKKNLWFQSDLSRDDIETMMSPIFRLYKSGKKLLMRVNIDNNKHTGRDKCIVYDEREVLVDLESVNDQRMIIPLVHIDGIKFSSRSFEVEMKLVQLMVLDSVPEMTQSCMIKRNTTLPVKIDVTVPTEVTKNKEDSEDDNEEEKEPVIEQANELIIEQENEPVAEEETELVNEQVNEPITEEETKQVTEEENNLVEVTQNDTSTEETQKEESIEELESSQDETNEIKENTVDNSQSLGNLEEVTNLEVIDDIDNSNELKEIDLEITEDDEPISLKKPNEVYYEIYKSARNKAKHMKQVAIQAYLEAKEIKTKYQLSDIEDSDDENVDINDDETFLNLAE